MSVWLKVWIDAWKHPKIVGLASDSQRFAYIVALCEQKRNDAYFASRKHLNLCLGPYAKHLKSLLAAGLIDELEDGRLTCHDFDERQGPADLTNAERQRRYRARHQRENGSPPVDDPVDNGDDNGDDNGVSDGVMNNEQIQIQIQRERKRTSKNPSSVGSSSTVSPIARGGSLKPDAVAARERREQIRAFAQGFRMTGREQER